MGRHNVIGKSRDYLKDNGIVLNIIHFRKLCLLESFEFEIQKNHSVRVPVQTFFNRNNSLKIENNQMSATRTAWAHFQRCDAIELTEFDKIEKQVGFKH